MITHIDGILEEKNPAFTIIDVNGIGYMLYITLNTRKRRKKIMNSKVFRKICSRSTMKEKNRPRKKKSTSQLKKRLARQ